MNNATLINQDSGNTEFYTPHDIINLVHEMFGVIDLDPASSSKANEYIKATKFYTRFDDSLLKPWYGKVWMNHPFSRFNNSLFVDKLVREYKKGNVMEGLCITYASTSEAWFRPLLEYPQCYIHGRTNYVLPNGEVKKGVTKGSVISYFGSNTVRFTNIFNKIGSIKI